ncbi:MAG: substrate-binding domain-containing protein [Paracoccaceae bacterium]
MRRRPTIREVAERAGCSVTTVSRVLNRVGRTAPATRARVEAAAAALDFRFDPLGRSLQARRTRTIGAVVPTLANPVFAEAIGGAQAVVRAHGHQLLLACTDYDPAGEDDAVAALLAQRVAGLILTLADAAHDPALARPASAGVPAVLLFNEAGAEDMPAVAVDNAAAAARVAAEMAALGHRRTAYLAGRFRASDRSRRRFEGFRSGCEAAGLAEPVLVEVDFEAASHCDALAALFARHPDVTALFCSNDLLGLRAIADLRALGRAVPGAVSVAGFDGKAMAALAEPSLATVATPARAMGHAAAEALFDAMEGAAPGQRLLAYEFRPGGSLAPPPGGSAGRDAATSRPASSPVDPR